MGELSWVGEGYALVQGKRLRHFQEAPFQTRSKLLNITKGRKIFPSQARAGESSGAPTWSWLPCPHAFACRRWALENESILKTGEWGAITR